MTIPFHVNLKDQVAVVTGGGGILCSVMADALAQCGAKVAILDLKLEFAQRAADQITKAGGVAKAFACNVLEKASIEQAHEQIKSSLGPVDILINGAGGNHPKGTTSKEFLSLEDLTAKKEGVVTFYDLTVEGIQFVFNLNFLGTFLPTQVFSKDMVQKGRGNIINVSSMNAFKPLTKIPAYSAAKAGVSNFTQWLAVHFSKTGVRVNAIAPGFFLTDQNRSLADAARWVAHAARQHHHRAHPARALRQARRPARHAAVAAEQRRFGLRHRPGHRRGWRLQRLQRRLSRDWIAGSGWDIVLAAERRKMATYFARGGVNDNISTAEKREALAQALKVINRPLRKVLLLPPDHTRLNSDAGELTALLYKLLSPIAEVDIMPALGTHSPMTEAQLRMMFGDTIPLDRFKVHDWRNGIRQVGEVPGKLIHEWSAGLVDYSVLVQVNNLLFAGYDLILSIGQIVPHEVVGMANYTKNIVVGAGGADMINKSHFLGAAYGMERMMGRIETPVRRLFNYAVEQFLRDLPDPRSC